MRDKVRGFIDSYSLIERGGKVVVALSGGADSVSLLHVLISLKEEYNIDVYAAHLNHMIRGEEADRDEVFVRGLCEERGIPLHCERSDIPAIAASSGESLELCGRRIRYEMLGRVSDELGGARIATAHNMSDNTETVLMNLTRGSGIAGLSGIPARRGDIIRPLLCVTRAEIEDYCSANGLSYVTDSTNLDDLYTRNKLRHNVIPALRELNPSLDEGVLRMSAVMREADDHLNDISIKELNKCKNDYGHSCSKLLSLDRAILGYAVRNILDGAGAPVDSLHIGLVIEAMESSGCVDLGRGLRAVCAQGTLRITNGAQADPDRCVPFSRFCTERASLGELARKGSNVNKKFLINCIPCDIITENTVARRRRSGDVFTDPDRGVTKTLKKLLNELKIPRELRDSLTVVADGSTVLWLEGVGTSKTARISRDYDGEVFYIPNKKQL